MILCFGGTFDPVHVGHIALARTAAAALNVPVQLVLSAWPTHRDAPSASISQRFELLSLACAPYPELRPDDREIRRDAPSFTVHTLEALRVEHPSTPLGWLIGRDSLLDLETWHEWPRLLELGHLVVLDRAGYDAPLSRTLSAALDGRWTRDCPTAPAGAVVQVPVTPPDVSATQVRARLLAGEPCAHLLPTGVFSYIAHHQLYGTHHRVSQ